MQVKLSEDEWCGVKDGAEKVISLFMAIKDKTGYGSIIMAFM